MQSLCSILLSGNQHQLALGETKNSIIARLGLPNCDVGNGCCNAWPDIFLYPPYELHFKNNQLTRVKDVQANSYLLSTAPSKQN